MSVSTSSIGWRRRGEHFEPVRELDQSIPNNARRRPKYLSFQRDKERKNMP